MKSDKRKFTWNDSEQSNQEAAYSQISEIAEEHGIEVFFSGGEQFAERIRNAGLKPSDFTVEDFEHWKRAVVNIAIGGFVEAERSAFDYIVDEKMAKKKKKNKKKS